MKKEIMRIELSPAQVRQACEHYAARYTVGAGLAYAVTYSGPAVLVTVTRKRIRNPKGTRQQLEASLQSAGKI